MRKTILTFGLFGLAACFLLAVSSADEGLVLDLVTTEGFKHPAASGGRACAHQQIGWDGNTHLEDAVGVENAVDSHSPAATIAITGVGWISSGHANSMHSPVNNNSYCAWCHMPGPDLVTNDSNAAQVIKFGNWTGVECIGCHTSHSIAAQLGTRYTNYIPGQPIDEVASYIARPVDNGRATNRQCLWCHGTFHGFSSRVKTALSQSGSMRCIDCHMAGFYTLSTGTIERYHNMKVAENLPWSCNGALGALISCHSTARRNWARYVIPKIFGPHTRRGHTLPGN